jgi:EamA domain-containing membrane protein RarD
MLPGVPGAPTWQHCVAILLHDLDHCARDFTFCRYKIAGKTRRCQGWQGMRLSQPLICIPAAMYMLNKQDRLCAACSLPSSFIIFIAARE